VVFVLAELVSADSVLTFAVGVSFFGFGAGGGGRPFTAAGDTVHHNHQHRQTSQTFLKLQTIKNSAKLQMNAQNLQLNYG